MNGARGIVWRNNKFQYRISRAFVRFHEGIPLPARQLCASHVICLMKRNEDRLVNLVAGELITVCVQYAAWARVRRSDVSMVSVWRERARVLGGGGTHFHDGFQGAAKSCGHVCTLGKPHESQRCGLSSHFLRWKKWVTEREIVDWIKWRTGSGHLVLAHLPFSMFLPHSLDIIVLTRSQWQTPSCRFFAGATCAVQFSVLTCVHFLISTRHKAEAEG